MLKIEDIKELYAKYNVKATKRFGQNFLINESVLKNIIKVAQIKDKDVIEIGPGLGSLTLFLLEEARSVQSHELDREMITVLKGEINNEKFKLIEGDFLEYDFDYEGKRTIVANIPYNITSDILFKMFKNSDKIDRAIIMTQKEVAQRVTAYVGTKNYGKLTITTEHFAEAKYEFTVDRNSFMPAPKVQSAILSLNFKNVDFEESKEFTKFVKLCFSARRKTLFNNLRNFMDDKKAKELVLFMDKGESVRPQELSYKEFQKLFKKYV